MAPVIVNFGRNEKMREQHILRPKLTYEERICLFIATQWVAQWPQTPYEIAMT